MDNSPKNAKGGSHYDKLRALKTEGGGAALCPKYCPILMKIGKQVTPIIGVHGTLTQINDL